MKKLPASLALAAVAAPMWVTIQPVTLFISGMTYSACPITVGEMIFKVDGVSKVAVIFEIREAVVTSDDAKTSVQKLTKVTGGVGYPFSVKQWIIESDLGMIMGLTTCIADRVGALGSVVSTMGCATCLLAIASLGAAIGLGFLQEYEGLFTFTLLPLFAVAALLANVLGWFSR